MESRGEPIVGALRVSARSVSLKPDVVILLFGAAIFVAAGLIFLLEPMIAKALLPTFGGAPQVWTAATVFFQAALLAGYGYAHFATTRLGSRSGALLHLALLAAPLLVLPIAIRGGGLVAGAPPAFAVLAILALSVGAPFVVISATSPLVQRWLSTVGHPGSEDPYFLYAAGNAGSLIGLLAYPFVVEPRFTVGQQAMLWSAGYVVFAVLVGVVAVVVARSARASADVSAEDRPASHRRRPLRSRGVPRCPAPAPVACARLHPREPPPRRDEPPPDRHRRRAAAVGHPARDLPAHLRLRLFETIRAATADRGPPLAVRRRRGPAHVPVSLRPADAPVDGDPRRRLLHRRDARPRPARRGQTRARAPDALLPGARARRGARRPVQRDRGATRLQPGPRVPARAAGGAAAPEGLVNRRSARDALGRRRGARRARRDARRARRDPAARPGASRAPP